MAVGTLDSPGGANVCATALEALAFGLVLCDAERRIVFANSTAAALAAAEFGRWRARTTIKAGTQPETLGLIELIDRATRQGERGVIRLTGQGEAAWIMGVVAPLCGGEGRKVNHAVIALRASRDQPCFDEATLAGLFRLSPAQAQIALALYSGRSLEDIARDREIKISTLRTHLTEIFARSGTETQLELVRLLAMLPPLR